MPEYIVPPSLKGMAGIGKRKRKFNRNAAASGASAAKSKYEARAANPLIAMELSKKKKSS